MFSLLPGLLPNFLEYDLHRAEGLGGWIPQPETQPQRQTECLPGTSVKGFKIQALKFQKTRETDHSTPCGSLSHLQVGSY